MIVTPWKALTCADDSHEWEGHTGPTDAWETIAERGLFDYRMCLRCQISVSGVTGCQNLPEDGELLIAEERERLKELEGDLK